MKFYILRINQTIKKMETRLLKIITIITVIFAIHNATAQQIPPPIQWQVSLGGSDYDVPASIQQTTDGGYIVAGYSKSTNGDLTGSNYHGGTDYWIVKLDGAGVIVWKKMYGGPGEDVATSVRQTADGGYIVAGYTSSIGGDVSSIHSGQNWKDCWVVKLDASGTLIWNKSLGGNAHDGALSVWQTTDNGYIVGGWTASGDLGIHSGYEDYYVVKLDASGTTQWQKVLGGTGYDEARALQQTSDGGYIIGGGTNSNDGDVSGLHNGNDGWVVKLDPTGTTIQWQKTLGGSGEDIIHSLQQTTDGGYIVGGSTTSNDGDAIGNHGGLDAWVVKLNNAGAVQWKKCLGGTGFEEVNNIKQTADGGYIVGGVSDSSNGDVTANNGDLDSWVVKLDVNGNIEWQKNLGGSGLDESYSIQQTTDNGYIVAISSVSTDGDVTNNRGGNDYWVVKLLDETQNNDSIEACISWSLLTDSIVSSVSGDITGQTEILGAGSNSPFMSIYGHNANGQMLWSGNTGWVQGAMDNNRYVQFDVTPASYNGFTVNNVSFDYSDFQTGTDFNIIAFQVGYSLNNWSTYNIIGQGTYLGTSVQTFTATPNVAVPAGQTFSLRIFPYALQNGIAMSPTFATHKNVSICGKTYPLGCTVYDTIVTHITVYDTVTVYKSVTDTLIIEVNISGKPGIPETTNTLLAYPNPAKNHLIINNGNFSSMAGYSIKVSNILGQTIYNQPITQQILNIDLSTWGGSGTYILNIIDPNQNVVEAKTIVLQ